MKLLKKPVYRNVLILLVLALLIAYVDGVRLSAKQAAISSHYINDDAILLGDAQIGSYKIFFFENEDEYQTIITKKFFLMWKREEASFNASKTDDSVKLVGWCNLSDDMGEGIMAVPVKCFDNNVSYIEMGPDDDRIRKDIGYGEVAVFTWDYSMMWNDLNAVAYSSDNEPLYMLGHEMVDMGSTGVRISSSLRWLPDK